MASEKFPTPLLPNGLSGIYDPATDTMTLEASPQGWTAFIKPQTGGQNIVGARANGKVRFMIQTDPDITPQERQSIAEELTGKVIAQATVGNLVGVSQPTIHRDLQVIKKMAASKGSKG